MNGRPTVVVTRHLSSPSKRAAAMESSIFNHFIPKRNTTADLATAIQQSKLLAALDALSLKEDDDDSEVEIVAAGPAAIRSRNAGTTAKGSKSKPRLNTERIATHPFFLQDTCSEPRRANTRDNTELKFPSRTTPNHMKPDGYRVPTATEQITRTSIRSGPGTRTSGATKLINARRNMETPPKSLAVAARSSYSYKDYSPTPTVVYTRHEEEANDLVASLKKGPIGFDMEWRVLWTRKANSAESVAQDRRVAIVQLADTAGMILVIQVFAMPRFPKKLQELIEDPKIPKLSANILNDGSKLLNDYGILAKNLFELGALVHMADPAGGQSLAGSRSPQWKNIIALAKLVAQYCQKTLKKPKNLRMGNWEAELNPAQVDYAASDAHCAIKIYERLLEIANQNGIPLIDENMQKRCSSSVPLPCRKLSKLPSSSDVQMEEIRSLTGQVRRFATMPNMETSTSVYTSGSTSGMRPQHIRAYRLWYKEGMSLEQMCSKLRVQTNGNTGTVTVENSTAPDLSKGLDDGDDGDKDKQMTITGSNSLKASTVIGYVIGALQTDAKLPFDMDRLRELVQMDGSSWKRHHDWLLRVWREGRGVAY